MSQVSATSTPVPRSNDYYANLCMELARGEWKSVEECNRKWLEWRQWCQDQWFPNHPRSDVKAIDLGSVEPVVQPSVERKMMARRRTRRHRVLEQKDRQLEGKVVEAYWKGFHDGLDEAESRANRLLKAYQEGRVIDLTQDEEPQAPRAAQFVNMFGRTLDDFIASIPVPESPPYEPSPMDAFADEDGASITL